MSKLGWQAYECTVSGVLTGPDKATPQDVAAALTVGLLLGLHAPEVARWLLAAEIEANDAEAKRQGKAVDSARQNHDLIDKLKVDFGALLAADIARGNYRAEA